MGVNVSMPAGEGDNNHWLELFKQIQHHKPLEIVPQCRVVKMISWSLLWENFLNSECQSFAVNETELSSLLEASLLEGIPRPDDLTLQIKEYLDFIQELSSSINSKYFDFLAICSSVLMISEDHLEVKIDQLFTWIDLNLDNDVSFEEFYLALSSYETGLSYLGGYQPISSKYIKSVAQVWFSICGFGREMDRGRRPSTDSSGESVGKVKFFEFCTNRQQGARKLLEAYSAAVVKPDKTGALQEFGPLPVNKEIEATGGDEWLANPPWKKTAELMTPPDHGANPSRPSSSLQLEWVHGCRGFDCRNNVRYLPSKGDERSFVFTAASLGVIQSIDRQIQNHFGDHTDDLVAISVFNSSSSASSSAFTVATGEMGKTPVIHLWDERLVSLACLRGTHTKAVVQLAHSQDGKFLFSVGLEYTVALYCIDQSNSKQFGKQVCSSQGPKSKILHASAYGSGNSHFVTCGEKHICFWTRTASGLSYESVNLSRGDKNKIFLSICPVGDNGVVIGASDDTLLLFISGKLVHSTSLQQLHPSNKTATNQTINSLWSPPEADGSAFFVGGKHGFLGRYSVNNGKLLPQSCWQLPEEPTIRSVCTQGDKLLICTLSCEIIEFNLSDPQSLSGNGNVLNVGHFKNELWGLAIRPPPQESSLPFSREFATVGDDHYLRVFSITERKQIFAMDMQSMARCCDYSPDGSMLAVGYGGRIGKGKPTNDGMFRVYRLTYISSPTQSHDTQPKAQGEVPGKLSQVVQIFEARDAKQTITEIKFSADNRLLVVGSKDNSIYIYSVAQRFKFKFKFKFSRHKASITHLDLSRDGQHMQSTCGAYELLFCNLNDGKPVLRGSSLMNTQWASCTCPLGWAVQGIWPPCADGTDVNAVDRSPGGTLLATADDFGKVKIFRYPVVTSHSEANLYSGHSSHVTNVRWAAGIGDIGSSPTGGMGLSPRGSSGGDGRVRREEAEDTYLISTGGNDKCIFQWKNILHDEDPSRPSRATSSYGQSQSQHQAREDNSSELEAPSGGDEFMAIKPWKGAIKAPSNFGTAPDPTRVVQFQAALGDYATQHARLYADSVSSPPDPQIYLDIFHAAELVQNKLMDSGYSSSKAPDADELELAWINGYRGFDSRNNVRYGCNGHAIIYFTASIGIVLFKSPSPKQLYFKGHTDDIISMATHEETGGGVTYVVTGQIGKGNTFVWSVASSPGRGGGGSISLESTFQTNQKSINVLEFSRDGRLVISIAEDNSVAVTEWRTQRVIANVTGEPAPTYHLCPGDTSLSKLFLCCGEKFIRVWSLSGRNLASVKIATSGKGKPQKFWCAAYFKEHWFVGCEDGSIYCFPLDATKVTHVFCATTGGGGGGGGAPATHTGAGKGSKGKKKPTAPAAAASGSSSVASAVTSFCLSGNGELLLSGSRDGTIAIYDGTRTQLNSSPVSLKAIFSQTLLLSPQIQSLCCKPYGGGTGTGNGTGTGMTLLVGTRGCDILELISPSFSESTGGGDWEFVPGEESPLMQGHCNDELWGLAVHPSLPFYVTVGDDKTLRHWRLHSNTHSKAGAVNRMVSVTPLGAMARACAFHPSGTLLAVGFGGRVGRGKQKDDGLLRLYAYPHSNTHGNRHTNNSPGGDSEPLQKVFEIKDAKQWISDLKFSPDGSVLAVGSHDNLVFFYAVTLSQTGGAVVASLKLTGKFSKHNSYLTHLDFSSDGRYLQSNCGAYELLFCDTSTKKQVTSATELRDVRWATWTCTLGWPAQGIWPAGADGTDVNAVDRSHSGHLLATSDDFGKVKIFRYPVITEGAEALSLSGHSSHVMNVRWTLGDECLLSCGGNDKAIFQWKHITVAVESMSSSSLSSSGSGSGAARRGVSMAMAMTEDEDEDDLSVMSPGEAGGGGGEGEESGGMGEVSGGDEFMAVKPWKGAIRAPELLPTINPSPPSTKLSLHWVHGYTSGSAGSHDSRISSNLFYNSTGEVIYPAAALGVCLTTGEGEEKKSQRYFNGHDDDILCLTVSHCKRYVATGQTASKSSKGKGSICIWDATSSDCRQLTEMRGCHARGVISLSFSPSGDKLLSIGLDNSYQHIVWSDVRGSWSRVSQLVTEKSDQKTHLYSRWTPVLEDGHTATAAPVGMVFPEYNFVSGGATSIHFWKIEGSSLNKKESRNGKYQQKPLLCAASLLMKDDQFKLISGTSSGDLYVFDYDSRECKNAIEGAHEGAILTLAEGAGYQFLISGGVDKCVKIWNQALQPITFHRFENNPSSSLISPVNASVASLDYRLTGGEDRNIVVLVGTIGGEILEIAAHSEQGPSAGAGRGNRGSSGAATRGGASGAGGTGGQGQAINFDLLNSTVTVLLHSHYSGELWGLAPHPELSHLVATVSDDGTIRLWDLTSLSMISCTVVGKPMRCVAWNSTGDLLAVGFYDTGKAPAKGKAAAASSSAGKGKGKAKAKGKSSSSGDKASSGSSSSSSGNSPSQLGACAVYQFSSGSSSGAPELRFLATGCPSNAWIADIKFSPLDRCLALASHDKKLYVYAVPDSSSSAEGWKMAFKKPKFLFNKHSSAVLHIDFTADEKYFQTNCQAYELLFGDSATGAQKTSATELSVYHGAVTEEQPEKQWASWTCTLGWPVQGIWQEGVDGSDINAVHRSPQGNLLATAEDSGEVKLYRYPCVQEGSKCDRYTGHSSHVTCVRWTKNQDYLTSVGGNDKCFFIWKVNS